MFESDYNDYFDFFINSRTLVEQAINTHLSEASEYFLKNTNNELQELSNLINSEQNQKIRMYNSYILGIYGDDLKFVQSSDKYIFDEILKINLFVKNLSKTFIRNLQRLYFIQDKYKEKYIQKAKKRNIKTIYNSNIGADILYYIDGEKYLENKTKYIGDRYGMQNCILDNINEPDNLERRLIIVLSFDVNLFEIYYSIPFNLYDKGTNALEHELIYCCGFEDIEPNKILEVITKHTEV